MNTTSTRWICRIVRFGRGLLGSTDSPHGFGSGHIASCAACQRYFAAADDLSTALRRDAVPFRQSIPAGFDERILRAIEDEAPAPRAERHIGRIILFGACAAAAVALLVVPLWRSLGPETPPNPRIQPPTTKVAVVNPLPELNISVAAVLQKDPLQKEVDSVYADARSAVRFLAANFLPEGATTPNDGNAKAAGG